MKLEVRGQEMVRVSKSELLNLKKIKVLSEALVGLAESEPKNAHEAGGLRERYLSVLIQISALLKLVD